MMTSLNRDASRAALAAGAVCATDVTGFGLLGHLYKLLRASGVSAVLDAADSAVPRGCPRGCGATGSFQAGAERNLDWVRPHLASRGGRGRAAPAGRRADVGWAARRGRGAGLSGDRRDDGAWRARDRRTPLVAVRARSRSSYTVVAVRARTPSSYVVGTRRGVRSHAGRDRDQLRSTSWPSAGPCRAPADRSAPRARTGSRR